MICAEFESRRAPRPTDDAWGLSESLKHEPTLAAGLAAPSEGTTYGGFQLHPGASETHTTQQGSVSQMHCKAASSRQRHTDDNNIPRLPSNAVGIVSLAGGTI